MAISPISNNQKGFTFAGESSKTYGVYITDGAFYDAPDRDGEMIEIPGRNGAYFLDKGRFKNIEVVYKAAMGAANETDFRDGIAAVRSWLCSKKGYQRLEDEFNPDEYRLAVFKDGAEVRNVDQKTGTFDIIFDCKPQRFLKSGETAVTVASGGTITNPTLFDARPMLEVSGYGNINIDGETINIANTTIGDIVLFGSGSIEFATNLPKSVTFDSNLFNTGDSITVLHPSYSIAFRLAPDTTITSVSTTVTGAQIYNWHEFVSQQTVNLQFQHDSVVFKKGTSKTHDTTITYAVTFTQNGNTYTKNAIIRANIDYAGVNKISFLASYDANSEINTDVVNKLGSVEYMGITGYSTKTALGSPLYFDLDIGEAYKIESGAVVSVNNAVSFPAELPVLKPDANTITFDNTVTQLKVVPRWWCV